jgi:molybdenum cofactor biosynthesis protein B
MYGINENLPFRPLHIAVLTVSDTRTRETDTSGDTLQKRIEADGHRVAARGLVRDDVALIRAEVERWIADPGIDVVITTGGTGLTGRDVTVEALKPIFQKEIDGFSVLFHKVSYESIGLSTLQSRACAGLVKSTLLVLLPGSPGACKDAWDGILRYQLDSRYRPCNFVELMPRLMER